MIYTGICEDNKSDPLKLGRIKVRVFGVHTDNRNTDKFEGIPTSDLPWANPVFNSSSIDGISDFNIPSQGSTVIVAFLDKDMQQLIYFGSVPKILKNTIDFSSGFTDPKKQHPSKDYINESPISRLARNEKIDKTILKDKLNDIELNIKVNDTSFSEPVSKYNTKYPENRVIETTSGHIIEIDNTKNSERLHVYHKTGSFIEIFPDGSLVQKIQGSETKIIINDNNILIKGNKKVRIQGSEEIQIDGTENIKVSGDINLESTGGKININADSNVSIDGGSGNLAGVVTGNHICHFTGSPHGDTSKTVEVSK